MDFSLGPAETEWRDRVRAFMDEHVRPRVPDYEAQQREGERWKVLPVIEELKAKGKAEGLWNLFMPPSHGATPVDDSFAFDGPALSNLQYAFCAEDMGHIGFASEVFNCSAPDTGNMEVINRYGTREQKDEWLKPLMEGEIRSAFLMTEPDVASSDATNIKCSIEMRGNEYVINGRKWWSSGAGDPRCKVAILMGKTDPSAELHKQQSMILVPLDAQGVTIKRHLPVFGYDDAPRTPTSSSRWFSSLSTRQGSPSSGTFRCSAMMTRRMGTWRSSSMTCVFRPRTCCSARAGASRSRRGGLDPAGSIIACGRSAWPRKRSARW
jgi:acyl-CoA dehydrogenase